MSTVELEATEQALEAARLSAAEYWGAFAYDINTDKLMFHCVLPPEEIGTGLKRLWNRWWARGDDAWLVFRSPRYVRLEAVRLSSIQLAAGDELKALWPALPASLPIDGLNVLLAGSGGKRNCIVCDSVGFYRSQGQDGWFRNTEIRRRVSLSVPAHAGDEPIPPPGDTAGSHSPFNQRPYFGEIEGATIRLGSIHLSHMLLSLVATGPFVEPRALTFSHTWYVDCPTAMHNARLRMATAEETESLRPRLHPQLAATFYDRPSDDPRSISAGHVIIECDEGVFSLFAYFLFLSWRDRSQSMFTFSVPEPLWRGGPRWEDL